MLHRRGDRPTAEQIRGEGDAERNRIFAEAFGKDPDFFAFYRSMQAYEAGLKANDTRMLLKPDSDFFRYFADPSASREGAPAPRPCAASRGTCSRSRRPDDVIEPIARRATASRWSGTMSDFIVAVGLVL